MAALDAILGGGVLLIVVLAVLPSILMFIAFWRMGYGLKLTGEALSNHGGDPSVAQTLARGQSAVQALVAVQSRLADAIEKQATVAETVGKAQGEQVAALVKQVELAVQWYVHSLQEPPKPKK